MVRISHHNKKSPESTLPQQGILYINKLFELEKSLSSEERKAQRLQQEMPVLEAFGSWIDSIKCQILPKSQLGSAVNYALNQKEGLMNYLKDGNCCISNNLAENSILPFTIGQNWLFSGSPKEAAASAAVYSII